MARSHVHAQWQSMAERHIKKLGRELEVAYDIAYAARTRAIHTLTHTTHFSRVGRNSEEARVEA